MGTTPLNALVGVINFDVQAVPGGNIIILISEKIVLKLKNVNGR